MEHEGDGDSNCNWSLKTIPKGLIKEVENLEIRQVETIPTKAFVKSARILKRLRVILGDKLSIKYHRKTIC